MEICIERRGKMTRKVISNGIEITVQFILSVIGIICLGALPKLFEGLHINFSQYVQALKMSVMKLIDVPNLAYGMNRPLFPQLFIHYKETMILFLASFFISLCIAFCIVYMMMRSRSHIQRRIKTFLLFLESIPDILLIIGSQILVVWFFQKTGFLPIKIAALRGESIRGLPIICLSIPTTIMFVKLLLLRFETELEKDYVLFARAKGFDRFYILNRHVLRNVLLSTLFFAKTNIWFMLSNLYIIEWLFNTHGIFVFIKNYQPIEVFTMSILLIYIPIFVLFKSFHYFVPDAMKERA